MELIEFYKLQTINKLLVPTVLNLYTHIRERSDRTDGYKIYDFTEPGKGQGQIPS